jgi:hypothetical protein
VTRTPALLSLLWRTLMSLMSSKPQTLPAPNMATSVTVTTLVRRSSAMLMPLKASSFFNVMVGRFVDSGSGSCSGWFTTFRLTLRKAFWAVRS